MANNISETGVKSSTTWNRFLNRYFRLVQILILLIVILVGYFLIIKTKIENIQTTQETSIKEKNQVTNKLDSELEKLKDLERLKQDFISKQAADIEKLNQILPLSSEKYNLIAQIEALIRSSGFSFSSLSITEDLQPQIVSPSQNNSAELDLPADTSLKTMNINFAVTGGSYQSFKQLLANLEKHVRLFDLSSISFASPTEEENTYTLLINTYYYSL